MVTIDVSFQVIHNGAAGYIADQAITDQINVLNKAYAPHKFQFKLRETRRTDNAALYTACGRGQGTQRQFKPQLRNPSDGPNVLYFYTCDLGPARLLGYATFPTYYKDDPLLDGVVCSYTTLPGGTAPFDLGQTATHEVGHWCVTAAYPLNMIHHSDRHFCLRTFKHTGCFCSTPFKVAALVPATKLPIHQHKRPRLKVARQTTPILALRLVSIQSTTIWITRMMCAIPSLAMDSRSGCMPRGTSIDRPTLLPLATTFSFSLLPFL
jgi:hypothetical protein